LVISSEPADTAVKRTAKGLKDWTIAVHVRSKFERVYRRGDPNKTLLLEFQGV
jgi:hypothetical protein